MTIETTSFCEISPEMVSAAMRVFLDSGVVEQESPGLDELLVRQMLQAALNQQRPLNA